MPTFTKPVTVQFYSIDPLEGSDPATFRVGAYPVEEVTDALKKIDLASGDYHINRDLFAGNQLFCCLHDGPVPVLGAYVKDMYSRPLSEWKGSIQELLLEDGEGLVDGTYVMFLPNSVAGLVRTSVKSPGSASVAEWLSSFTPHKCHFAPLPSLDAVAMLERGSSRIRRVVLKVQRAVLPQVRAASPSAAKVLDAAAGLGGTGTKDVKIELTAADDADERHDWWTEMQATLTELIEVFPDMDIAKIETRGSERAVNLRRSHVRSAQTVMLEDRRLVGPGEAAEAVRSAYQAESSTIQASLTFIRTET